ncbi:MAG: stage II sporulation protein R [Huintestinicola sp.]
MKKLYISVVSILRGLMERILSSEQNILCAVMIFSLFSAGMISAVTARNGVEQGLVRLHILAESDSEEDQALKIKVRDAILAESDELFAPYSTKAEAEAELAAHLDKITAIAENTLRENGCSLPVAAEMTEMEFDTRIYDEFTVPAGTYTALRVTIGSGSGHNWWCVMYPPLCVPCAAVNMTNEEIMEKYGRELTEEELIMMAEEEDYEVRFFIADLIGRIIDNQTDKPAA